MVVPNAGLAVIADRINPSSTLNPFRYVQYGSGTAAENVTNTDLATPITSGGGERTLATGSRATTNTANDTAQWDVSHTFTADKTIEEIAIFTEAAGGDMGIRQLTGTLLVKNGDTLYAMLQMIHDQ